MRRPGNPQCARFCSRWLRKLICRSSCCHFRLTALVNSSLAREPRKLLLPQSSGGECCKKSSRCCGLLQRPGMTGNSSGHTARGRASKNAPTVKITNQSSQGEYRYERNKSNFRGRGSDRNLWTGFRSQCHHVSRTVCGRRLLGHVQHTFSSVIHRPVFFSLRQRLPSLERQGHELRRRPKLGA